MNICALRPEPLGGGGERRPPCRERQGDSTAGGKESSRLSPPSARPKERTALVTSPKGRGHGSLRAPRRLAKRTLRTDLGWQNGPGDR